MNIQTLLTAILNFLNSAVIPFLLAIAFIVFIWNIFRYFILGGDNEESQEKAKSLALWGITAFVVIISLWGIVNLLARSMGFLGTGGIVPDYMCQKTGGNCIGAPTKVPSGNTEPLDNWDRMGNTEQLDNWDLMNRSDSTSN